MPSPPPERTASLMTPAMLAQLRMGSNPAAAAPAWPEQYAADAGVLHARRQLELRGQLEAQAAQRDYDAITRAGTALAEALPRLDFALLQPKGLLARMAGKGKADAAGFAAQHERIERALSGFADQVHELRRHHQILSAQTDATLVDFDAETRAVEQLLDQGARWLQDTRTQLRMRETQSPDDAARRRIEEDTDRCDRLTARLKDLRASNTAAHRIREVCDVAAARRLALLTSLQQALDGEAERWQQALAPLAEAVRSGAPPGPADAAVAAHQALQPCVAQAIEDCRRMHAQEAALVQELASLAPPLQAAA
jgi:hypothetical protein